jgi:anti-anti-sigma regulatory factor
MLRISIQETPGNIATLHLEGHLAGAWIAELSETCERILIEGKRLVLDLQNVSLIDRPGFDLLAALSHRAVSLVGCSPFQAEQLRQLSAALEESSHSPS